jgi:excisionase family DNA binding protein
MAERFAEFAESKIQLGPKATRYSMKRIQEAIEFCCDHPEAFTLYKTISEAKKAIQGKSKVTMEGIMNKQIMTTMEVAEFLEITQEEVRRLVNEGMIKSLKGFRKPFKFSRQKVFEYLEKE